MVYNLSYLLPLQVTTFENDKLKQINRIKTNNEFIVMEA